MRAGHFERPFVAFLGSFHAAVATGIARGAMADLAATASSGRRQLFAAADLRDLPGLPARARPARRSAARGARTDGGAGNTNGSAMAARSTPRLISRKACRAAPGSTRPAPTSSAAAIRWAGPASCSTRRRCSGGCATFTPQATYLAQERFYARAGAHALACRSIHFRTMMPRRIATPYAEAKRRPRGAS